VLTHTGIYLTNPIEFQRIQRERRSSEPVNNLASVYTVHTVAFYSKMTYSSLMLLFSVSLLSSVSSFNVRPPTVLGGRAKLAHLPRKLPGLHAAGPNDDAEVSKAAPSNFDRLKEESANPFRTFRLFLYGASGASALIGGLTSCAQLAGTLGDAPAALPLPTVVTNLGVDFGVVAAAVALYRFENANREAELADAARSDVIKKAPRLSKEAMSQREAVLKSLPLTVMVDDAGGTKRATVFGLHCPYLSSLTRCYFSSGTNTCQMALIN